MVNILFYGKHSIPSLQGVFCAVLINNCSFYCILHFKFVIVIIKSNKNVSTFHFDFCSLSLPLIHRGQRKHCLRSLGVPAKRGVLIVSCWVRSSIHGVMLCLPSC